MLVVIKVPLLQSGFVDMGPMFTKLLRCALAGDDHRPLEIHTEIR